MDKSAGNQRAPQVRFPPTGKPKGTPIMRAIHHPTGVAADWLTAA
jgi:hypothetical protein